jgi:hypothetical protein
LWLKWVAKEKAFIDISHGFVVVEVGHASIMCSVDLNGVQDDVQRYGIVSLTAHQVPVSHLVGLSSASSEFKWALRR